MAAIFKKEDGAQSRHVYNWASTLAVNVMNNATAALSPSDRASLDKVTLAFVVSPAEPRVSFARVTCLRAFESGVLPPSRCIACHTLSFLCSRLSRGHPRTFFPPRRGNRPYRPLTSCATGSSSEAPPLRIFHARDDSF